MAQAPPSGGGGTPQWWIVYEQGPIRGPNPGGKTFYGIFRAASSEAARQKDINQGGTPASVDGPFDTRADAQKSADAVVKKNHKAAHQAENKAFPNPFSWLADESGGVLASALESGTDHALTDLWRAIAPWIILPVGVLLIILGFVFFFKNQLSGAVGAVGSVAAMVAK